MSSSGTARLPSPNHRAALLGALCALLLLDAGCCPTAGRQRQSPAGQWTLPKKDPLDRFAWLTGSWLLEAPGYRDTEIYTAQVFSTAMGGAGTKLDFPIENEVVWMVIDLPFTFRFNGVDYDTWLGPAPKPSSTTTPAPGRTRSSNMWRRWDR